MSPPPTTIPGLRCAYRSGEPIVLEGLPPSSARVCARAAWGEVIDAELGDGRASLEQLPVGTHAVEAWSAEGELLSEELTSVRDRPGDDPILGFATSFDAIHVPGALGWLTALRCTVVQIYDWMAGYSAPIPQESPYRNPLGRVLDRGALQRLIDGLKAEGAVAQAYAPVYAADSEFGDARPELRLYRTDGRPQSLGDLLQIMDPANPDWQRHWLAAYGAAADTLGFDGFHLDTYGYPRCAADAAGDAVPLDAAYRSFVDAVRTARPGDAISFNQVNGVPRDFEPPTPPGFRYVEVWPPNDRWRHLEGLLERSRGASAPQGDTLAIYPPVWSAPRESALRTALLTEAVTTALGAGVLLWGDDRSVLKHPYYVDHERLLDTEVPLVLEWHRFALRCRDLFRRGLDTSWYELGDENGAVSVVGEGVVSPEPVGGSLFVRVRRTEDAVAVSLLDLGGSPEGSWAEPSGPGQRARAEITVLVDDPSAWSAEAAALGRAGGRFRAVETHEASHREGRALSCSVELQAGWSVLRLRRHRRSGAS